MGLGTLLALFVIFVSGVLWYCFFFLFLRIDFPSSFEVSNTKCISLYYVYGVKTVKKDSFRVNLSIVQSDGKEEAVDTSCVVRDGQFKIFFPAKVAGFYRLKLELRYCYVKEYDFFLLHLDPDPTSIHLEDNKRAFLQKNTFISLRFILKDVYGNVVRPSKEDVKKFKLESNLNFHVLVIHSEIYARASTYNEGSSQVRITYRGCPIKSPSVFILYVSESTLERINEYASSKGIQSQLCIGNYIKGTLIEKEGIPLNKTIYFYIRSGGLIIKEYVIGLIPRLVYQFPISHKYTKLELEAHSRLLRVTDVFMNKVYVFTVSDGLFLFGVFLKVADEKSPVNFDEKVTEFFSHFNYMGELTFMVKSSICVDRHCLLYTSLKALQSSRWQGPLRISFNNELGIDDGGVRKEWYTLIWKELIEDKVFIPNERGSYAPNPVWKDLSIFEQAGKILGKALQVGANPKLRLFMPFSLSSGFLSLLKGMNVGYRHFEIDYPEFYYRQIEYIAENSVEDLDLYFVDEIYDDDGSLIESKSLKSSGNKIEVTNANKFEYLNLLAKYRLSDRIKGAVSKFKSGLHTYVSEELLLNFDESELDLLISGFSVIDFDDLKKNHHCEYVSSRVQEWFWLVLKNLSEEQKLLFLKFITGSSRLPPNGFKGLTPTFTIRELPDVGKLPSSHVCANILNLHPHSSFEAFESSFITAITEGYAGFENY